MNRILSAILKQRNIGRWWGGLKYVAQHLTTYVTAINLALISVTAYYTTLAPWFHEHGWYIRFWHFELLLVISLASVFLLEYKIGLPSYFDFFNEQFYQHNNPLRQDMANLSQQVKELKEELEKIANGNKIGV